MMNANSSYEFVAFYYFAKLKSCISNELSKNSFYITNEDWRNKKFLSEVKKNLELPLSFKRQTHQYFAQLTLDKFSTIKRLFKNVNPT